MQNCKVKFQPRPIFEIAKEVKQDWQTVNSGAKSYIGAKPYLDAMTSLVNITDKYYEDSAKSIIAYFLANAGTWRGETAKRVKVELNKMLKM